MPVHKTEFDQIGSLTLNDWSPYTPGAEGSTQGVYADLSSLPPAGMAGMSPKATVVSPTVASTFEISVGGDSAGQLQLALCCQRGSSPSTINAFGGIMIDLPLGLNESGFVIGDPLKNPPILRCFNDVTADPFVRIRGVADDLTTLGIRHRLELRTSTGTWIILGDRVDASTTGLGLVGTPGYAAYAAYVAVGVPGMTARTDEWIHQDTASFPNNHIIQGPVTITFNDPTWINEASPIVLGKFSTVDALAASLAASIDPSDPTGQSLLVPLNSVAGYPRVVIRHPQTVERDYGAYDNYVYSALFACDNWLDANLNSSDLYVGASFRELSDEYSLKGYYAYLQIVPDGSGQLSLLRQYQGTAAEVILATYPAGTFQSNDVIDLRLQVNQDYVNGYVTATVVLNTNVSGIGVTYNHSFNNLQFNIIGVNQGTKEFTIEADYVTTQYAEPELFPIGSTFTITGSTGNNGAYTVANVTPPTAWPYNSMVVQVNETIPSTTADGQANVVDVAGLDRAYTGLVEITASHNTNVDVNYYIDSFKGELV